MDEKPRELSSLKAIYYLDYSLTLFKAIGSRHFIFKFYLSSEIVRIQIYIQYLLIFELRHELRISARSLRNIDGQVKKRFAQTTIFFSNKKTSFFVSLFEKKRFAQTVHCTRIKKIQQFLDGFVFICE